MSRVNFREELRRVPKSAITSSSNFLAKTVPPKIDESTQNSEAGATILKGKTTIQTFNEKKWAAKIIVTNSSKIRKAAAK